VNITIGFKPLKPVLQSANYKHEELHAPAEKIVLSVYNICIWKILL